MVAFVNLILKKMMMMTIIHEHHVIWHLTLVPKSMNPDYPFLIVLSRVVFPCCVCYMQSRVLRLLPAMMDRRTATM